MPATIYLTELSREHLTPRANFSQNYNEPMDSTDRFEIPLLLISLSFASLQRVQSYTLFQTTLLSPES
jgi:hypothetical protein